MRVGQQKSPDDVLQEELLREKAQVLGRAGESLARALEKLHGAEVTIEDLLAKHHLCDEGRGNGGHGAGDTARARKVRIREINVEIRRYNALRDEAKIRFYYLIVTREAMGMRRHGRVEEFYKIPPSRSYLRE